MARLSRTRFTLSIVLAMVGAVFVHETPGFLHDTSAPFRLAELPEPVSGADQ
jgi:hypothetical protein